jgi:hypothetical protein
MSERPLAVKAMRLPLSKANVGEARGRMEEEEKGLQVPHIGEPRRLLSKDFVCSFNFHMSNKVGFACILGNCVQKRWLYRTRDDWKAYLRRTPRSSERSSRLPLELSAPQYLAPLVTSCTGNSLSLRGRLFKVHSYT